MAGIATFGPGKTSGIPINGTFQPVIGMTNRTPASDTIYVPGKGVLGDETTDSNVKAPSTYSTGAASQYGDPSQYDSQIQAYQGQLGGLQGQQDIGIQNNLDAYTQQHNRLGDDQATAERGYNTGVQQNTQSYQNNRTKVLNSSRANANALQRLLGINGAGNSSAAYEQAPYAAALQGSQDIGQAQQTFGTNATNLDQNWQDTQRKYKNAFEDLDQQKYQGENSVKANVMQSRADLLDKIATASVNRNLAKGLTGTAATAARDQYQPEIDGLLQQITQLGRAHANPVIQAQSVSANPIQLTDYAQGRQLTAQNQGNPGGTDISPNFISTLLNKRDLYGNVTA